jgi:hypothetical protein
MSVEFQSSFDGSIPPATPQLSFLQEVLSLPRCVDEGAFASSANIAYGSMNGLPYDEVDAFSRQTNSAAAHASALSEYMVFGLDPTRSSSLGSEEIAWGKVTIAPSGDSPQPSKEGSMICLEGNKFMKYLPEGATSAPGNADAPVVLCTVKPVPVEDLTRDLRCAQQRDVGKKHKVMPCVQPILGTPGQKPTYAQFVEWNTLKEKQNAGWGSGISK